MIDTSLIVGGHSGKNECNSLTFFRMGQFLTYSSFWDLPISSQLIAHDQNDDTINKELAFVSIIFRLNPLSHLNTMSMRSNLASLSGENAISLRYSK